MAAHAAALTTLPSALWRLALALGFSAGYTDKGFEELNVDGWGWLYLVGLSVVTEAAALMTVGLVRPWGEVVPHWVPWMGGRAVRRQPVVVVAAVGATILVVLWTPFLFWWSLDQSEFTALGATLVGFLYLPLVLWGPLLAAVTMSYARRHRVFAAV
ncbi:MAG: hypothetical protein ACR2KK_22750 [Acidimicrobiales bacterium]